MPHQLLIILHLLVIVGLFFIIIVVADGRSTRDAHTKSD
jgi:hypothetical protein